MPTLQFKGKNIIWNHHLSVPFHTLEEVKKLNFQPEKGEGNLIIEGDNLIALKALLPLYSGKIKCIYIDPPYNTGNEGWVYNDKVNSPLINEWYGKTVNKDDLTKHDIWLCMLLPRIRILRELLVDDGVIFISIDENEQHRLRMLLDEIFGEDNFIGEFIWKNKHGGGGDSPHIVKEHEHILFYSKNFISLPEFFAKPPAHYEKMFREEDDRGKFYFDRLDKKGIDANRPNLIYPIKCPDGTIKDISPNIWRLSKEEFERRKDLNEVGFKKDKNDEWQIYTKTYLLDEDGNKRRVKARSILKQDMVGFTQNGNKEIEEIFGDRIFPNPKPVNLIKYLIDMVTSKISQDIVLDSFAGSGTTMQAIMELNKEDIGNRKCILVQMKEDTPDEPNKDICEDITRERVKRAIKLYGYDSGFKYLRVGKPIDAETMLDGELPKYEQFAKYVYYLCTGENLKDEKKIKEKDFYVGEFGNQLIYLLYKQDFKSLTKLALTLDFAEKIIAKNKNKRIIVYAPSCFLDQEYLEENQIEFVGIPYNLFQRNK